MRFTRSLFSFFTVWFCELGRMRFDEAFCSKLWKYVLFSLLLAENCKILEIWPFANKSFFFMGIYSSKKCCTVFQNGAVACRSHLLLQFAVHAMLFNLILNWKSSVFQLRHEFGLTISIFLTLFSLYAQLSHELFRYNWLDFWPGIVLSLTVFAHCTVAIEECGAEWSMVR